MGVPPNHSVLGALSIINHPFWDTHIYGNPHIYIHHDTREWNITSPLYDSLYISPLWYHYTHYIPLFIILSIISHLWIIILIFIPLYPIDLSWIVDIYRYVIFESIIYMINYSILWIYNSHYDPIIHDIYIPLNPIYDPRVGEPHGRSHRGSHHLFPTSATNGPSWAVQMRGNDVLNDMFCEFMDLIGDFIGFNLV